MDARLLTIGGVMVVGFALGVALRGAIKPPSAPKPRPMLPTDLKTEVERLIAANKVIDAIKLVRQQTNCGLKEAKDMVDGLKK